MSKKSLKEVFEFFPNAKWITECEYFGNTFIQVIIGGESGGEKPEYNFEEHVWSGPNCTIDFLISEIGEIDWGHRRTWNTRCVSREEVNK